MPHFTASNPPPLVRPGEKTLFTPVRDWLAERVEISWPAKFLYARLERYAGKTRSARPTQAQLARDMGVSDRCIRNYVAELRADHGGMPLLWVVQRGRDGAARYYFPAHPWRAEKTSYLPVDNLGTKDETRKNPSGPNGETRKNPSGPNAPAIKDRARGLGDNAIRGRQPAARGGTASRRGPVATERGHTRNQQRIGSILAGIGKPL